jgi:hypothetical protein
MDDSFTTPAEIAMLNIAHFTKLSRTPLDDRTRGIVERLLANEKARLDDIVRSAMGDGKIGR